MKKISKYILITSIAFLFSCKNKSSKEIVTGIVTNSEWYVYSVGFSTKAAKGYYKQKIEYSFVVEDRTYYGEFNNGPDIGPLFKGDSIMIEIKAEDLDNTKVVKKLVNMRNKFPSVSSKSLKENAFDSAYIELLNKSHLPEFEITN
jgi:hypothetical protein